MNRADKRRQKKLADKLAKTSKLSLIAERSSEQHKLSIQQAIAIAVQHHNAGDLIKAEGIYQQILQTEPNQPVALHFLGVIAHQTGNNDTAIEFMTKAINIKSDYAEAHNNLGVALKGLGRMDEAIDHCQKAIDIKPGYAEAHNNLGSALKELGRINEAVDHCQKAIDIKPNYAEAHNNLGNAFTKVGRVHDAVAVYQKAVAINPNYARAHNNLASAFTKLGQVDQAVASYRRALDIKPDFDTAVVDLLFQLRHTCAWSDVDEMALKVDAITHQSIQQGRYATLMPFDNVISTDDVSENYAVAKAKSDEKVRIISGLKTDFQFSDRTDQKPRITIGYLSCDYRNHATAHLMSSLLGLHDRKKFNIFTFSYGSDDKSAYREKIITDSDRFFDLQNVGHQQAAEQIFDSGVDILIDLKGHTQGNRLEICALRPAPVQATYLGFPGTTGAGFIDYIITDRIVSPENQSTFYSEQMVYLPHTYQVNDHKQKISDVLFRKSDAGLPDKGFVFCSFNTNYKIEPVMFDVWMNLLKRMPDSVLWLFKSNHLAMQNLKREAQARGVEADRLVFAEGMPKDQHLARCRLADLALDTRICGGHTTTSDMLWAGVPVVTLQGAHFASRVASSLLTAVGMPELITYSMEEYEDLCLKLSQNSIELEKLTAKLALNRLSEPLFDTPRFVSNLESAYCSMWENFISGKSPSRIDVIEGLGQ